MSRHRNVRAMNYSDEYDGFDDVYGHSVEDDYCVSPSAQQFLFDRSKQHDISAYVTEDDIAEEDENQEEAVLSTSFRKPDLSDIDQAKLESCIEIIKNVVGDSVSESTLTEHILKCDFNADLALDAVLKAVSSNAASDKSSTNKENEDILRGKKVASSSRPAIPVISSPAVKVIPSATRSVVKGFDLSGIDGDLLHAKIESPRSQSPASGQASPSTRRKDNTFDLEIKSTLSKSLSNTPRCQSPALDQSVGENDPKTKTNEKKLDAAAIFKSSRGDAKEHLHLVVVGHVDAGKSTLLGRLLCDLGQVSSKVLHKFQQESKKIGKQSFAYAWVLDETGEERERGITMDVGHSKFETSSKFVTLLDAPGHKDFIPNMITGATQADVALLVVDATRGEFETGFDSGGQTREHALLLRSLGVSQLAVVVNKLDTVEWSKERFDEIVEKMSGFLKHAGFRDAVTFVPCSGLSGENLVTPSKEPGLSAWYKGPTLVEVIDKFKCPERPVSQPFRFSVNDIYKGTGSGFCVSGHVETGMVSTGDKVLVLPHNEVAFVKGLQISEMPVTNAFAGDQLVFTLTGIDQQVIAVGDILCDPRHPVPTTTRFQAHIVVFAVTMPITRGLPVVIHQQSLVEPAVIKKLIAQLHKSSGEVIKNKPRCLPKNASAIVEIETQRPICMELYRDVKQLGRVMLRVGGTTVAAGLITKIC